MTVDDDRCTEDDGELVTAGGQTAPAFQVVEPVFEDIAAAVVDRVECWLGSSIRGFV
ncbi:hypothetical protein [Rhodococcus sp. NPDC003348]